MTLKTFRIVKSEFDILMWFITRVSDKDSPDRPTKPMDVLTIAKKEAVITVATDKQFGDRVRSKIPYQ